jgi:catechol 2,3-dioxygenase-like lactoylglutathione lyase family enzyme
VSDFDASVDGRSRHFGFSLDREGTGGGTRMGMIANGLTRIELFATPGAALGPDETGDLVGSFARRGLKHVALEVADVDAAFETLRAAGLPVLSEPATNEAAALRYTFLRDPDGNHVGILTPL